MQCPASVRAEDGQGVIFPVLSHDRKQQEHTPVLWVPAAARRRNEENAASQIRPPVRTRSIPADSSGVITACVVPPQTLMTVNRSRERVIVQTAPICLACLSPVAPRAPSPKQAGCPETSLAEQPPASGLSPGLALSQTRSCLRVGTGFHTLFSHCLLPGASALFCF